MNVELEGKKALLRRLESRERYKRFLTRYGSVIAISIIIADIVIDFFHLKVWQGWSIRLALAVITGICLRRFVRSA